MTLFDEEKRYPLGLEGMADFIQDNLKPDLVPQVPIQCIVGEKDKDTWEITIGEDEIYWTPGINDTGKNRIERLTSLATSLRSKGCQVQIDLVPDAGHNYLELFPAVQHFFASQMNKELD